MTTVIYTLISINSFILMLLAIDYFKNVKKYRKLIKIQDFDTLNAIKRKNKYKKIIMWGVAAIYFLCSVLVLVNGGI